MIVFSLQALAYLMVAANLPPLFLYLSIGFYGIVAWSIPSIMVAAVSEYVGVDKALAAFGLITSSSASARSRAPPSQASWLNGPAVSRPASLWQRPLHARQSCLPVFEKNPITQGNASIFIKKILPLRQE